MTRTREPTFRDLSADEATELLARNHIGRIAYSFHDRVDIEPLSYVFADGAIYLRTAPGFEVDEVEGPFDWRSVVAHGTVYVLQDGGGEIARETYRVALGRIRQLVPMALTPRDPTPTRQVIIKLHLTDMRGRSASSSDSR